MCNNGRKPLQVNKETSWFWIWKTISFDLNPVLFTHTIFLSVSCSATFYIIWPVSGEIISLSCCIYTSCPVSRRIIFLSCQLIMSVVRRFLCHVVCKHIVLSVVRHFLSCCVYTSCPVGSDTVYLCSFTQLVLVVAVSNQYHRTVTS